MSLFALVRDGYGQARGYRRLEIRREAACAARMTASKLADNACRLRQARYLHAIGCFPAYADLVRAHVGAEPSDLAKVPFDQLPVLTKTTLSKILAGPHSQPSSVITHCTGGSTGQPFRFFITRESFEWRTAVSDRGYSWAKAEEGQRSFYVWGTAIQKPGWKQRIKAGVHHWLQNRKYFDSFQFDDDRKAECCRKINRFKPVSLVGYAGSLIELARYVSRHPNALTWRARTCVTAAEGLRPGMRELIVAHLADDVFMSYGSREFMLIGIEGPDHDGYHIAADNLYVEVVDDNGKPLQPGELGRIVITDLHNDATPFVRYAIGDLGKVESRKSKVEIESRSAGEESIALAPKNKISNFEFGISPFPKLASVEGRLQEVVMCADGERLTALFIPHLMKEFAWVDGYQVVQDSPGKITMNLVTRDDAWEQKTGTIGMCLGEKLGDEMEIRFTRVAVLVKNASGKTPIVLKHGNEPSV